MFDFSRHMSLLMEDIAKKVSIFSHIRASQILISCADARQRGVSGTWAQLYPMKYENGHYSIRERVGGKICLYRTDRLSVGRREILYIMYFMMPRFQNLYFFQKLETIFHELYHVSPECDGRLRILHPRYVFHGPSAKLYDKRIRYWVQHYLSAKPDKRRLEFLNYNLCELKKRYGEMNQIYIPEPKETMRIFVSHKPSRQKKIPRGLDALFSHTRAQMRSVEKAERPRTGA